MTAQTPIQYQTYTNDPTILDMVAQYKAARAEADAAVKVYMDNGIGDTEAAENMQAKQEALSTIETRLCVMFVGALDRNE